MFWIQICYFRLILGFKVGLDLGRFGLVFGMSLFWVLCWILSTGSEFRFCFMGLVVFV